MTERNPQHTGKVAFITGGGTGIGKAAALAFARQGASVVLVGHQPGHVEEAALLIEQEGGRALAVTCDVSRASDVQAALQATIKSFGRLDFAFNNAGIEQPRNPLDQIGDDDWSRLIDVNLRGVFLCMKHQVPLMLTGGGGVIVNTSSGAGVRGFAGQAAYAASKCYIT